MSRAKRPADVTMEAETGLRDVTRRLCESYMEEARKKVERSLEGTFHAQLAAIHRRSFPRRTVAFLDAMGSAGITIVRDPDNAFSTRNVQIGLTPDGFSRSPGIRELEVLLDWYVQVSGDAHVCIDELRLEPLTLED